MGKRREIDWSSAEVQEGTLTVRLDGRAGRKWCESVDAVLRRLGADGGIEVKPSKITVPDVRQGKESDLRFLLESAVMQVNTALAPEGEEDDDEPEDEGSSADREMTEAFRGFA
jgi:phage protein D